MPIVTARVCGYAKPLVAILGHIEVLVRLPALLAAVSESRKIARTAVEVCRLDYSYRISVS